MSNMFEAQMEAVAQEAQVEVIVDAVETDVPVMDELMGDAIIGPDGTVEYGRMDGRERNDASEDTEERRKARAEKQRQALREAIIETRQVFEPGRQISYTTKKGIQHVAMIGDSDPMLYLLREQPNAPQLTAQATETRSGPARLSDEA